MEDRDDAQSGEQEHQSMAQAQVVIHSTQQDDYQRGAVAQASQRWQHIDTALCEDDG